MVVFFKTFAIFLALSVFIVSYSHFWCMTYK